MAPQELKAIVIPKKDQATDDTFTFVHRWFHIQDGPMTNTYEGVPKSLENANRGALFALADMIGIDYYEMSYAAGFNQKIGLLPAHLLVEAIKPYLAFADE